MTSLGENDTPLDDVAVFNRQRWNELAANYVGYSVPALDLDRSSARTVVDRQNVLGDMTNKRVLCLAAGGGQQSAAFALLGSAVTVLDLSPVQLDRDRQAARHYGYQVQCELGDMRDLTRFDSEWFDVVWQAHSLNFVPDARTVFAQVARVLRDGGLYRLEFTNPFIHGTWESSWTGQAYLLAGPYVDREVSTEGRPWKLTDDKGSPRYIAGPREFRHTLATLINGLLAEHLEIRGFWEDTRGDALAPPGSWGHFKSEAAPWMEILSRKRTR